MENKQFPEQDDQPILPEDAADHPAETETLEELPVFEELTFSDTPLPEEKPEPEIISVEEALPELEEAPAVEEIPAMEAFPAEEDAFVIGAISEELPVSEEAPAGAPVIPEEIHLPNPSFMDRIPDVDEDYPAEQAQAPAEDPEAETGSVMDIVNDPEFALPVQPEQAAEDVNDQEYRDNGKDFDNVYAAPAPERDNPYANRATRKGRPKRKKGEGLLGIPNILVTFVWLGLILAIGVTLGRMLWVCAADVLAFGREDRQVTITVYEADSMEDIVDKLYDAGLIRYKSLFNLYASISDAEEDIKPGIYDLNTRYDYHALVNFMSPSSSRQVIELTIPEGYTCRQIFELLEENRVCTAVDIGVYAAEGELSEYWFLEGVERGSEYCLEGYLFPDTYQFYKNSSPREALERCWITLITGSPRKCVPSWIF